jgi:hypothetical protein
MFDDDGAVAVDVVVLLSRCSFAPFDAVAAVVVFVEFDEYFLLSLYESLVDIHV